MWSIYNLVLIWYTKIYVLWFQKYCDSYKCMANCMFKIMQQNNNTDSNTMASC